VNMQNEPNSPQHNFEVVYFDQPMGRGEPIRLAFYLAGIPFSDHRIPFKDWPEFKPKTPYGGIPLLKVDNLPIFAQSNSILRYVGKITGIYPKNDLEALRVDEILDSIEETSSVVFSLRKVSDPEKLKILSEEMFLSQQSPFLTWLANIEKTLQITGGNPWVIGTLTIADLKLATFVNRTKKLDHFPSNLIESYARISQVSKAVMAHSKVVEWYETKAWEKFQKIHKTIFHLFLLVVQVCKCHPLYLLKPS